MAVDTTTFPYDTIVQITDTIGGQDYQASGVLISPDEVLTASHVVYIEGVGTASNIVVTPGYDSGSAPFGSADGTSFHYYPIDDANDLIPNSASQSDYAVIHLSSTFPTLGTMGLLANYAGGAVTIAGYPASAGGALVVSSQTVVDDPTYTLLDGAALGPGSSGAPVFVGGASDPQVVGIVSSAAQATQVGVSPAGYNTLITNQAFNQIEQWVASDDAAVSVTRPPPATPPDESVSVSGTHTQYIIANADGDLYYQDLVANRDGSATLPGVDEVYFSDGFGRFDPTGDAEDVARLYGVAFDRGADLSGLNYWTHQIDTNTLQLGSVAMAFVDSGEFQSTYGSLSNQDFVAQLYENALGRAGDASGSAYWASQLDAGLSRGTLLIDFSNSFEYREANLSTIGDKDISEAYRLYQAAFDRAPDTPGLQSWVGLLDAGTSPLQVAQDITATPEFRSMFAGQSTSAEISMLYENVFHRAGDPSGTSYWTAQLQGGASVAQVLLGFSDSLENRIATAGATHDAWVFTTS